MQYYKKISKLFDSYQIVEVIFPDQEIRTLFIEQYAYNIYADYNNLVWVSRTEDFIGKQFNGKTIFFITDYSDELIRDVIKLNRDDLKIFIGSLISLHKGFMEFSIKINKNMAYGFLEYELKQYPVINYGNGLADKILSVTGLSFHNISYVIRMMFFGNVDVGTLNSVYDLKPDINMEILKEEQDGLADFLILKSNGSNIVLANLLVKEQDLKRYIEKGILFRNGNQIIPETSLYLVHCKKMPDNILSILEKIYQYVINYSVENDDLIIEQLIWLVNKLDVGQINDKCVYWIDEVEQRLFDIFRFTNSIGMLEFINVCLKKLSISDVYIYFLVNSAIIYMDMEKFDVALNKVDHALKLCSENDKMYYFVLDEKSRLFERMEENSKALNALLKVERYYVSVKKDVKKIRNVRNRIGENLCFIGYVKKAVKYLEDIFYQDYNGQILYTDVLSCEVANNLSLCYLELGKYEKALDLQDILYKAYLRIDNSPINYATDILQNKGNVFLYEKEYDQAEKCFEMALQDEKNPFSRQLILENYVYAKAYAHRQFDDAILFFESQVKNSISDETKRLLAEMYYEGGYYEKCIEVSDEMIGIFKSKQKIFDLVALLLCRAKSESFIKKMNMLEKEKNILQLTYYKQIIRKNIGKHTFYYDAIEDGIAFLKGKNRYER